MGSGCAKFSSIQNLYNMTAGLTHTVKTEPEPEVIENMDDIKLLLLGAGESGKSTIVKQMKIIHDKGFSDVERSTYKSIVFNNIVHSMATLLKAMKSLQISFHDDTLSPISEKFFQEAEMNFYVGELSPTLVEYINRLWKDSGLKEAFDRSNEYHLSDSAGYFLDNLSRISKDDYVPTEQDVIRSRLKTTGIVEIQFQYKGLHFRLFDVGGQRSERKKWIRCFDDVKAVIFVAALSDYDLNLVEDDSVNRLHESIKLFGSISNNRFFEHAAMILFLNKKDVFEEKIKTRSINICFPKFEGPDDFETTSTFIQGQFEKQNQKPSKEIYTHFTCATDSNNIRFVFDVITDLLVRENLESCGLY